MIIDTFILTPRARETIGDSKDWFNWKIFDELWRINEVKNKDDIYNIYNRLKKIGTKPHLIISDYKDPIFNQLLQDEDLEIAIISLESFFEELDYVLKFPPEDLLDALNQNNIILSIKLKQVLKGIKNKLRSYFKGSDFDARWSALMGIIKFDKQPELDPMPLMALAASNRDIEVKQNAYSGFIDENWQYKVRLDHGTRTAWFGFFTQKKEENQRSIKIRIIWLSDSGDSIKENQFLIEKDSHISKLMIRIPEAATQFELLIDDE